MPKETVSTSIGRNPDQLFPGLLSSRRFRRNSIFPGISLPAIFHYAGRFHDDQGREPVPFPRELLNGKPLIYASLGTLVNGLGHVYRAILEAATELPEVQLVLSVGQSINPDELRSIPSNAIIVRTAPQLELLKGAALCITH